MNTITHKSYSHIYNLFSVTVEQCSNEEQRSLDKHYIYYTDTLKSIFRDKYGYFKKDGTWFKELRLQLFNGVLVPYTIPDKRIGNLYFDFNLKTLNEPFYLINLK